jgi:hypothetical protein
LGRLRFWPFDCWEIPKGYSVLAEVYPSLWMNRFPIDDKNSHQRAAYAVTAWLQRADKDDSLSLFFNPPLEHHEKTMAEVEGWILGAI